MNYERIESRDGNIYWIEQGDTLYSERLQHGQYQKSNWLFAQTLIPQYRRCLDIGSNNACNAIHYAQQFEWVECFEPVQTTQELWRRTIQDNQVQNVTLHTLAVSDRVRDTEMYLHPKNGGHNHICHDEYNPRTRGSTKQTQTVSTTTIDEFEFDGVDFVKIDVEGHEWFVLQGAQAMIQANRPVLQLEIVANQCRKFNYGAETMIDWIRHLDYRCVSKRDGWLDGVFESKGKRILYNGVERRGDMDLFFVPSEHNTELPPKFELFEFG